MISKLTSWIAVAVLSGFAFPASSQAATINWSGNITNGQEVTWYSTNTYVLSEFTYVLSNAVLKIQPGTVIQGEAGTNSSSLGALIVTRGGKLFAEGTASDPIIFTSTQDDVNDPNDLPLYSSGLWGGVTLLGNGALNSAQDVTGNSATPIYDIYEGLSDVVIQGQNVNRFGGDDDNDSSGTLRYVSIRYSGFTFDGDKELNGLTMGGVGKGTTLEHVEVIGSSDDGFEWWGGCVNGRYLSAAFCEDDSFDFDQGYRGCLQFLFAVQKPTVADKIIETDGDLSNGNASDCVNNEFPRTLYTIQNLTAIGSGFSGGDTAVNSRDESGPNIFNSAFLESTAGILIDNDGLAAWTTCAYATMSNSTFQVLSFPASANESFLLTGHEINVLGPVDPTPLVSVSRTNDASLDPRPNATSTLLTNVLTQVPSTNCCAFVQTCYRGAFSEDANWLSGWSGLETLGVLAPAPAAGNGANVVNWSGNITNGQEVTWYSTNTYVLSEFTYVLSNAVLKIQPGTVIQGEAGTNSSSLGALIVTRGGKLFAEGTASDPIIFTSTQDDVNDPNDLPLYSSGLWGGVTLLGNGALNSAQDVTGNSATPIYDIYEGLSDVVIQGQNVNRFGGDDDNDSSGTLRYVSIRYSGFTFDGDKELNGLTMGGVGKGTTLEHVEVIGSSDDGFEWWGGCVNGRYLSAAFCEDDSFDFDQGYRGCLQFLFAVQKPTVADKIIETDGDLSNGNASDCVNNEFPRTLYTIQNLTAIGSGFSGGDTAVNSRDESGPNIFNSAFLESTAGMDIDSDGFAAWTTCGYATMSNSTFQVVSFAVNGTENFLLTGYENNLLGPIDPTPLVSVSRTNDASLDPRPNATSTLLTNVLTQVPSTNCCAFVQTCYRGAFSENANWLSGWSGLETLGVLAGAAQVCPEPTLSIVLNGSNVDISWPSSSGCSYQLQTNSVVNGVWGNYGAVVVGDGTTKTESIPANGAELYIRAEVQ